jgi:hypothetical protein
MPARRRRAACAVSARRALIARPPAFSAVLAFALLAVALLCGCGERAPRGVAGAGSAGVTVTAPRPAFGLTEDNAALLWRPTAVASVAEPAAGRLQLAREELTALHPRYVRLLIDWAALQPDPRRPPALEATVSGCARTVPPCTPYAGVRAELAAIASQQRAQGAGGGGFAAVVVIFGTPAWAASPPAGCERGGLGAFSRPPSVAGIAAYRSLIHALVALGRSEGVALDWWTPWNEPDDPTFLTPQRAACSARSPARSPSAYAALARAMMAQLRSEGGPRHLLLGEFNAYETSSADRLSMSEFLRALPTDVTCLADAWSVHAYANRDQSVPSRDPVATLEAALDARRGCTRGAHLWVTESGAGAPHAGYPRPAGATEERASCLALASQLRTWFQDPRLDAVLQYTFRDDPAFPTGLAAPGLDRTYPAYRLWLEWIRAREAGQPPPGASACG